MSNVRTVFTSDDADVINALKRQQREHEKLRDENRKLKEQSKKTADEGTQGIVGQIQHLKTMAAGVAGVSIAVQGARQAYADWRKEMEEIGRQHATLHKQLLEDLTTSGDLLQGGRVREALATLPDATREQGRAAFAGVRAGAPAIELGRALDVTKEVSRAAPILSDAQLEDLGKVAGTLAELAPEKEAGDVADLAHQIRADLGKNIGQASSEGFERAVRALMEAGVSLDEAAAITVKGIQAGAEAGSLASAFGKLSQEIEVTKAERGQALTPEQEAKNRLALQTPLGRLQTIISGMENAAGELVLAPADARRALLGEEGAVAVGRITPEAIETQHQNLWRAQRDDALAGFVGAAEQQPAFQDDFREHRLRVQLDKDAQLIEEHERIRQNQELEREARRLQLMSTGDIDAAGGAGRVFADTAQQLPVLGEFFKALEADREFQSRQTVVEERVPLEFNAPPADPPPDRPVQEAGERRPSRPPSDDPLQQLVDRPRNDDPMQEAVRELKEMNTKLDQRGRAGAATAALNAHVE